MLFRIMILINFCLSESKLEEMISKLRNEFDDETKNISLIVEDVKLSVVRIQIYLYDKEDPKKEDIHADFYISYADEENKNSYDDKIRELLNHMKRSSDNNQFICTFNYRGDEKGINRFIHDFNKKLEDEKSLVVNVILKSSVQYSFYNPFRIYCEVYDDEICFVVVLKKPRISTRCKTRISDDFVGHFLREHAQFYFENIKDDWFLEFFKDNFMTSRLLFINIDRIDEIGKALENVPLTATQCLPFTNEESQAQSRPNMRCLYLLFYFLKEARFLESMVQEIFKCYENEEYRYFTKIMQDLGIGCCCGEKLLISQKYKQTPILTVLNDYLRKNIIISIKTLKINDKSIGSFRELPHFLYFYMKVKKSINVDYVLSCIDEFFFVKDYLKVANESVLQKLFQIVSFVTKIRNNTLTLDVDGERHRLRIDLLPENYVP